MLLGLVIAVILLERILHYVEKKIGSNRTYHEMLQKMYKELMIFGLVGLGVKLFKEVITIKSDDHQWIAFQVADYMMFVMALDGFEEVFIAEDLIELVEMHQSLKNAIDSLPATKRIIARISHLFSKSDSLGEENYYALGRLMQLVHTRTLRHFFVVKYGLPYSFPFAKYLKKAQDKQISMMLEVQLSTWIVLLLVLIVWELIEGLWADVAQDGNPNAIFYDFTIFVWLSLLTQIAAVIFLDRSIIKIAKQSGHKSTMEVIEWLKQLAAFEKCHQEACKSFKSIIHIMLEVEREQEQKQRSLTPKKSKWLQWYQPFVKNMCKHTPEGKVTEEMSISSVPRDSAGTTTQRDMPLCDMPSCPWGVTKGAEFSIKFFNPTKWEKALRFMMMYNAFFFAFMFNAIFYQMSNFRLIPEYMLVPLPVCLNMLIMQPRIFQGLILLSSIVNIRMDAFVEIISEFKQVTKGRSDFIEELYKKLLLGGKDLTQLHIAFVEKELENSGHITLENFWIITTHFGLEYSECRLKSMIETLFPVLRNEIWYTQIERLLSLYERTQHYANTITSFEKISHSSRLARSVMDDFQTGALSLDEETRSVQSSLARKRSKASLIQNLDNWSLNQSHISSGSSYSASPTSFVALHTEDTSSKA
ncbi:Ev4771 [Albugo candida]|uniref:Ev4771 protein n=1 Tax=Albugo candida TaxID=65357 RepID=A0A024G8M0_9STRA|nr:Ev4771 [Albugo candida]|eukprot:CCI42677.1 Ev4771 [Albugo candida]